MSKFINKVLRCALSLVSLTLFSVLLLACGDTTPTQAPSMPTQTSQPTGIPNQPGPMTGQVATAPQNGTPGALVVRPGYITGETLRLGAGLVQSWVKVDENNKPSALGVTLTDGPFQPVTIKSAGPG